MIIPRLELVAPRYGTAVLDGFFDHGDGASLGTERYYEQEQSLPFYLGLDELR